MAPPDNLVPAVLLERRLVLLGVIGRCAVCVSVGYSAGWPLWGSQSRFGQVSRCRLPQGALASLLEKPGPAGAIIDMIDGTVCRLVNRWRGS